MPTNKLTVYIDLPQDARLLEDTNTHVNRFDIKSSSSNKLYRISQNRRGGWWECSCPGWIGHGGRQCKHLRALGLPGDRIPFDAQLPASVNQ